ncbi:cytochrome P450 [Pseudonocardia sp. RS010]|uniref:cytochrome P450 n=1 Tax=Pseudonocardia sp. RS010 TaxID=3385979 RepID=UPI00399EFB25
MEQRTSEWDPLSEYSVKCPAEHDNEVRSKCPVAWSDQFDGFWGAFSHEAITQITRDTDSFVSAPTQTWPPMNTGAPWLPLQSDPPQHRQYRKPLVPFFRGERVASFEPRITELTNELIDKFADKGRADLAFDLNIPLPAMGICLLLGLPEKDWEYFYRWTTTIVESSAVGDLAAIGTCFQEVTAFADEWIARRRKESHDDIVDAMLRSEVDGRPLTDNEIRGTFTLIFSAGHQTTADALTTSMIYLAKNPEDRHRLAQNPDLLPAATVEFIRLAAPIRALARTAVKDTEVEGRLIKAGEPVTLMFGAGSRDEKVFDNPDAFDPARDNRRHLAFGTGIHRCIGEELAKLEVRVVLQELLRRIPDWELDGEGDRSSWPTNGYHKLPVTFPVAGGAR